MITENRQCIIAKIELGKMISCIIDKEHIPESCLNKEMQEALLEFRRQKRIVQCIDCGKHFSRTSIYYHKKNSCKAKKQQTKIENKESQQSLLEACDESQIVCGQLTINDPDDDKNNAGEERQQSLLEAGDGSQPPLATRKRKFLNTERFTQLADSKIKKEIAPIKKWIN